MTSQLEKLHRIEARTTRKTVFLKRQSDLSLVDLRGGLGRGGPRRGGGGGAGAGPKDLSEARRHNPVLLLAQGDGADVECAPAPGRMRLDRRRACDEKGVRSSLVHPLFHTEID